MHQVDRPADLAGEGEVARDHQALAERRPRAETELGCDQASVRVPALRERGLLAVDRDRAAGDGAVLQRAAHHARGDDRAPVVGESDGAGVGELAHLRELDSLLLLRDRREEADRHLRLSLGPLAQAAQHVGLVDDRLGVRHGEDRAVASGRGGCRACGDRLLVFAAGSAQMHVRVDERRSEDEPRAVDDSMPVRVDVERRAALIVPWSIRTSRMPSRPWPGSRTRAPRITRSSVPETPKSCAPECSHATSTTFSTGTGPLTSRS